MKRRSLITLVPGVILALSASIFGAKKESKQKPIYRIVFKYDHYWFRDLSFKNVVFSGNREQLKEKLRESSLVYGQRSDEDFRTYAERSVDGGKTWHRLRLKQELV